MQLVVRQQLDGAVEVLAEHLRWRSRCPPLPGADRIQLLLEGDAVESFAAVGEQTIQQRGHALLPRGFLNLRPIADVSVDS